MLHDEFIVFTGSANKKLALDIANYLNCTLGKIKVGKFSDGETTVEINEHVRGKNIFIVQPTSAPANDHIMEMMLIIDALRRASAKKITAVIPYFGYSRQDRRMHSLHVPISAKIIANMLQLSGVNHLLTMDLHADQIQGFFDIPVDNIYAFPILFNDIKQKKYTDLVIVSPDMGGVTKARILSKKLNADLAIVDKYRPRANYSEVMNLIGDVQNKTCVIMDDMVDTAGTLCKAAHALKQRGAISVISYCTHPILSGNALETISQSELDELVVTDSIQLSDKIQHSDKIRQLSCANLLGEAISCIAHSKSISTLFIN